MNQARIGFLETHRKRLRLSEPRKLEPLQSVLRYRIATSRYNRFACFWVAGWRKSVALRCDVASLVCIRCETFSDFSAAFAFRATHETEAVKRHLRCTLSAWTKGITSFAGNIGAGATIIVTHTCKPIRSRVTSLAFIRIL